jgi:hypothetical protein
MRAMVVGALGATRYLLKGIREVCGVVVGFAPDPLVRAQAVLDLRQPMATAPVIRPRGGRRAEVETIVAGTRS